MTLVLTVVVLTVLITVLMRPEIFLKMLRGGGEKTERRRFKPKSEAEFQAGLSAPPSEKKEHDHG
ncbi:MAG: hypothetical protein ACK4PI_09950 [Tepidisphaerales bacterium]